jgi:hypothetical protein
MKINNVLLQIIVWTIDNGSIYCDIAINSDDNVNIIERNSMVLNFVGLSNVTGEFVNLQR